MSRLSRHAPSPWQTDDVRRLLCAFALVAACASPSAPSSSIAGTWAESFSIVGASLILTVDSGGNGSGTYAIEAGRSGTVQVTGHVVASMVTLTILYDYSLVPTFSGALTDVSHLSGTFTDSSGTVVFTRR